MGFTVSYLSKPLPPPGVNFTNYSTSSFYTQESQVKQLFALLGSAHVKAAYRMLVKLNPEGAMSFMADPLAM